MSDTIAQIRTLQAHRKAMVRMHIRITNAALALIRRTRGWKWGSDEKERKAINAEAQRILKQIQNGKREIDDLSLAIMPFLDGRKPFEDLRKDYEKQMAKLARDLPAFEQWNTVQGLGPLGLAILIGEAGDLANYPDPAPLMKRFGVLPYHGKAGSTWMRQGGLKEDQWSHLGYAPHRRSALYTIGDSVLKKQVMKVKDDDGNDLGERVATGKYGEIYIREKAKEMAREDDGKPESLMHAHRRAQRVMEQQILTDLWGWWNEKGPSPQESTEQPECNLEAV